MNDQQLREWAEAHAGVGMPQAAAVLTLLERLASETRRADLAVAACDQARSALEKTAEERDVMMAACDSSRLTLEKAARTAAVLRAKYNSLKTAHERLIDGVGKVSKELTWAAAKIAGGGTV